ncbi:hypothetical protein GGS21DRAFT_491347 [Xylaria nigripes]|nr:hypothetical protein GGS21DRAFT_491347 [Xylaria nigripes]
MFFEGSLQEGISTALRESKQVVCFVTDHGSESQQWEDEFLVDDSIRSGLQSQSVILKLLAGSEEAGYLEALFPVPKKPTVVIIQNGQLKEYIASGTTKEELVRRLGKASPSGASQSQPSSSSSHLAATPAVTAPQSGQSVSSQPLRGNGDSLYDDNIQPTATPASSSSIQGTQSTTSTEEEKRAAAKRKGKARAENQDDDAHRRADERRGVTPTNPEQSHANELKLRRQQANEERKRILKRIEDDKRARKEREAEARNARILLSANVDAKRAGTHTESVPLSRPLPRTGHGTHCNLQVRLLDGSTMRTRFPSDKTLGQDVRKWIDGERTDGNAPYSFRIVLTPMPNKMVEPQEEIQSLLSLGLAPSATLVLTPTKYSVAYAHNGGVFSPVIRGLSLLYASIWGFLGRVFALLFGGGGGGGGNTEPRGGNNNVPMENLRARRNAQLYNGNSLNFEPRNEDDEENNTR